jgi:hypothetical protein
MDAASSSSPAAPAPSDHAPPSPPAAEPRILLSINPVAAAAAALAGADSGESSTPSSPSPLHTEAVVLRGLGASSTTTDSQRALRDVSPAAAAAAGTGYGIPKPSPSAPLSLPDLPYDLLTRILAFLPAPDVARAAATSLALRDAAHARHLWFDLFVTDFDTPDLPNVHLAPKRAYAARLAARTRRIRAAVQQKTNERASAVAAKTQAGLATVLGTANICTWLASPFLMLLLLAVFVALKLDGDVDWPWPVVFVPLWLWMAAAAASTALACCLYRHRLLPGGIPARSRWAGQYERLVWTPPVVLIKRAFEERPRAVLWGLLAAVLLFLAPILIAARAEYGSVKGMEAAEGDSSSPAPHPSSTFPWAAAFLPLWLLGLVLPLGGCVGGWLRSAEREARVTFVAVLVVLVVPFLVVLASLCGALDAPAAAASPTGMAFSLHLVLIPIWMLCAILAIIMLCHCTFALHRFVVSRDVEDVAILGAGILIISLVALPPFLTLALLSARVDDPASDISFKRILGPMWFWLIAATLVSCGGAAAACFSLICRPALEQRRAEPDPFGSEGATRMVVAAGQEHRARVEAALAAGRGGPAGATTGAARDAGGE